MSVGGTTGDYTLELKIKVKDGDNEKEHVIAGNKIAALSYTEGLACPTVECNFALVDTSSDSLMSKLPIKGGEDIEMTVKTADDEEFSINLTVYGIVANLGQGSQEQDKQVNILKCMSREGMRNLATRVEKLYKETNPVDIVKDILTEKLNSGQDINTGLDGEVLTVSAMRDRPFDFISRIVCRKSIPTVVSAKGAGVGTAGYLFWQTSKGYHFYAMDELMGAGSAGGEAAPTNSAIEGEGSVDTYYFNVVSAADDTSAKDERRIVQKLNILSNNDVEEQLYRGTRSNLIGFFDISSMRYKEEVYTLSDGNFETMGHLADSDGENKGLEDIWNNPTRVMTRIISNEMYESSSDKAQEDKYDKIRQSLAQQIVRADLFGNQRLEINIPGNAKLHAGDKIILQIYKSVSDPSTAEEDRIDKKQSGYYLIGRVAHTLQGNTATTHLLLMRDQHNEVTDD